MSYAVVLGFMVLATFGLPIAFAMGVAAVVALWASGVDFSMVPQRMMHAVNSFPLMSIPFFMLAGEPRARGLEASAALRSRGGLSLSAAYTWLDTAVLAVDGASGEAPPPFEAGDPLIRRPRQGLGGCGAGPAALVGVHARRSAGQRAGRRSHLRGIRRHDHGGRLRGPASGRLVGHRPPAPPVASRGEPPRRAYEEAAGYPALGRSIILGARVAAGR